MSNKTTAREIRSFLFEIENQEMTIKELRAVLFDFKRQDAEVKSSIISNQVNVTEKQEENEINKKNMTMRQKFEKMLCDLGMFESQAKSVMDLAIPIIDGRQEYKYTWDRPSSEYRNEIYAVLFLSIKPIALEWIDENLPMAWYRPMFK